MEATRSQLTHQISQQSVLSESSTIAPAAQRLGPAPSLAGLRQFAAKLGVKISSTQNKPVDDLEKQATFVRPVIQYPLPTYQQSMEKPAILEVRSTPAVRVNAFGYTKKATIVLGATSASVGIAAGVSLAVCTSQAVGLVVIPFGAGFSFLTMAVGHAVYTTRQRSGINTESPDQVA